MSINRMTVAAVGLAFSAGLQVGALVWPDLNNPQNNDPYKPRQRSKGEKARNRRCRAR